MGVLWSSDITAILNYILLYKLYNTTRRPWAMRIYSLKSNVHLNHNTTGPKWKKCFFFQFSNYSLDCKQYIPSPRAEVCFLWNSWSKEKRSSNKRFWKPTGYSICKHWYYLLIERNSDDNAIACSDNMCKTD